MGDKIRFDGNRGHEREKKIRRHRSHFWRDEDNAGDRTDSRQYIA